MTIARSTLVHQRSFATHQADSSGFSAEEAKQLLEFCIELNNQDDRNKYPDDSEFRANLGPWRTVFDSREGLGSDPAANGFGPFRNAWLMLRNQSDENEYALAIRGTIGQAKSILNDFLATTISAYGGIEFPEATVLPIAFAATPGAELHLGFAYAAFTLLFEKNLGIIKFLQSERVPAGARLMITGHSQGAAIATMVHAFLHYAFTDPVDRYGLQAKRLKLKSYVFAQPKPGNYQFALDFAQIAGSRGAGFVINNSLDPVTLLPLSQETFSESITGTLEENRMDGTRIERFLINGAARISQDIFKARNAAAELISDNLSKLYHQSEMKNIDISYFQGAPAIANKPVQSLNYTLSGSLVPLFGDFDGGTLYPLHQADTIDALLQHHATTYRKLLHRQFFSE
jgi:hypothetical protein